MSDKTIVALFDERSEAEQTVSELEAAGFSRSMIDRIDDSDGVTGDLIDDLSTRGVPSSDASAYAEGVRRGGTLLAMTVDDDDLDRVIAVLERHNFVDIDARQDEYRRSGWTSGDTDTASYGDATGAGVTGAGLTGMAAGAGAAGMGALGSGTFDATMRDTTSDLAMSGSDTSDRLTGDDRLTGTRLTDTDLTSDVGRTRTTGEIGDEAVIPVVEEQLEVGKRVVNRGRIRVHSRIVETPIEEQVTLRDETVRVERRPVDRLSSTTDPAAAFQEQTFEVTETDEEAVVAKTARVTEEVVVRKDVDQRTETISDKVRRTEVDVENDVTTDRSTSTGRTGRKI